MVEGETDSVADEEVDAEGDGKNVGRNWHAVAPVCNDVHIFSGQGMQLNEALVAAYVLTGQGKHIEPPTVGP